MISLEAVPLTVVQRARSMFRSSGESIAKTAERTGISVRAIGALSSRKSAAIRSSPTAVRYLRTVHGLPPTLTEAEVEQTRSILRMLAAQHKRSGVARSLGMSGELIRRVVIGLDPPSVLMWAALMPHAIGCHDLIASPVANRSEGAAQ